VGAIRIEIQVSVPGNTPADAKLYLAGNLTDIGSWRQDGVLLTKASDGTYSTVITEPEGTILQYKLNRGTWLTVEKASQGEEIADRTIYFGASGVELIRVASWRDIPAAESGTGTTKP
jgi:hypothetical protein